MTSPNEENITIIPKETLDIPKDYERVSYLRKRYKITLPPFRLIGRGGKNKGGTSMNLVQEMSMLSKPASWLFAELEKNLDYSGITARIVSSKLNESEIKRLRRGYKELRGKDLVRRVKQNTYMINPTLIIPPHYNEEMLAYYNSLK